MNIRPFFVALLFPLFGFAADTPNIIFILADDMGVGDVSHMGGKAATPFIDQLAAEGMRFTDAHTSSSVCTPTRYSVLTGRYNWRTHLKKSVYVKPKDRPLIEPGEATIASVLKTKGYHSSCVGKWHLGIGWQFLDDYKPKPEHKGHGWDIDYSKPAITPTSNGFDEFFGIQASLDMAPYVYIRNDLAIEPGTVLKGFNRPGAATPDFEANQCLIDFARESVAYIDRRAEEPDTPFFLYLPLTSPHTPIVPSEKWLGKSVIGEYGDFLMETDWVVGEVMRALEKHGMKDTLLIFSTDNGCSPRARFANLAKFEHFPSGKLRGHKADIYEGGHRVPFIARWPGTVKAGSVSDRLTCQTDLLATFAEVTGVELADDAGVDSVSFLPTLLGKEANQRGATVHHSIGGFFAIRKGKWKLCLCPGSGGWSAPRPGKEPKGSPQIQLFDLESDPAEENNLQADHPKIVKALTEELQAMVDKGRSTPGEAQPLVGQTSITGPGKRK